MFGSQRSNAAKAAARRTTKKIRAAIHGGGRFELLESRVLLTGSNAMDRINFGDTAADAYSESVHHFDPGVAAKHLPQTGAGALGQTYRQPYGTSTGAGDEVMAFTMTVDPVKQNYITVRLWGGDTGGGAIYYGSGYYLDQGYGNQEFPNRFMYATVAIPLSDTQGKTSIPVTLSNQSGLNNLSRPIYSAYTSTEAQFVPDPADPTGVQPTQVPLPALSTLAPSQAQALLQNNRQSIYGSGGYYDSLLARQVMPSDVAAHGSPKETVGLDLYTNVQNWAQQNPGATPDQWRDRIASQSPGAGYTPVPQALVTALSSTYVLQPLKDLNGNAIAGLDHYHDSSILQRMVYALDGSTYLQGPDGSFQENDHVWDGVTSTPRGASHSYAGTTSRQHPWSLTLEGVDTYALGQSLVTVLNDPVGGPAMQQYLGQKFDADLNGASMTRAYAYERMFYNQYLYLRGYYENGGTTSQLQFADMGAYASEVALARLQQLFPNPAYPAMGFSERLHYAENAVGLAPNDSNANLQQSAYGTGEAQGVASSGYDGRYGNVLSWLGPQFARLTALDTGATTASDHARVAAFGAQAQAAQSEFDHFISPGEKITYDSNGNLVDTQILSQEDYITYRDPYRPNVNGFTLNQQYLASDPAGPVNSPYALRAAYLGAEYSLSPGISGTNNSFNYLSELPNYENTIISLVGVDPNGMTKLPGEPAAGDSAWVDTQVGDAAVYNRGERLYVNGNYRSENVGTQQGNVSNEARVHDTTATVERIADIQQPYNSATVQSDGNLQSTQSQPYVIRYGNYLMVFNHTNSPDPVTLPAGDGQVEDLLTRAGYAPGSIVSVLPNTSAVFWLDQSAPRSAAASRNSANGQVTVMWQAGAAEPDASSVTGYTIQRSTDPNFTQNVANFSAGAGTFSYVDTAPPAATSYYYRIRATLSTGYTSADAQVVAARADAAVPTVATTAYADNPTVNGMGTGLHVRASDQAGAAGLTYAWSVIDQLPNTPPPAFTNNGSNAGQDTTVTFGKAGLYVLQVTATNAAGLTATSQVTVNVQQTATALDAGFDGPSVFANNMTREIHTTVADQFGAPLLTLQSPTFGLQAGAIGSIHWQGTRGYYQAPASGAGADTITITYAGLTATVPVVTAAFTGPGVDVGSVGQSGSDSYDASAGVYTVSGGGADIWGAADAFHFLSTANSFAVNGAQDAASPTVAGDFGVQAQVTSQTNTDPNAKAGVMIRASADPAAAFADVVATPGNVVSFQWRSADGVDLNAANTHVDVAGVAAPVYVKVTRTGNGLSGYYSTDGNTWVQIGTTQTVTMAAAALGGLAVTSHNNAALSTATFANAAIVIPGAAARSSGPWTSGSYTQVLKGLTIGSPVGYVPTGGSQQLSLATSDQYNYHTLPIPAGAIWAVTSGGGSVTNTGLFTAGSTPGLSTITVTGGGVAGTLQIAAATIPVTGGTNGGGDVGAVGLAGSDSLHGGVYTVAGSGADISGATDQFRFVSRPVAGDASLVAQVLTQTNTGSAAKAGVMIRASAAVDAAFADVVVTTAGVQFSVRAASGGAVASTLVAGSGAPLWVKLSRSGDSYSGFSSPDGVTWTQIGAAQTAPMNGTALAGLAVTAATNAALSTATFHNVLLATGNNAAPTIAGVSAGATTLTGAATTLAAAPAAQAGVTYAWTVDAAPADSATPAFAANGDNAAANTTVTFGSPGVYTFRVVAANATGQYATGTVTVNVVQTLTGVTVTPFATTSLTGIAAPAAAVAVDQFGAAMPTQPAFTWSVAAGTGAINPTSGSFAVPTSVQTDTITAAAAGVSGSANVAVYALVPGSSSGVSATGGGDYYANNTHIVTGRGAGVSTTDNNDSFQFLSRLFVGDGSVSTQITSLAAGNPNPQAGVMVRDQNGNQGSAEASVFLTAGNTLTFAWRSSNGAAASAVSVASPGGNVYVKVTRAGGSFGGYYSTDGNAWTQIGSTQTITMTVGALAGLAVSSGTASAGTTAAFANTAVTFNYPLATALVQSSYTMTASTNPGSALYMNDGAEYTMWSTNRNRYAGDYVQADLGSARTFQYLQFDSGTTNDSPTGFQVMTSNDGTAWATVYTGSGSGPTITSVLLASAVTARYVRVQLTQGDGFLYWHVGEFNVFGVAPAPTVATAAAASPATVTGASTGLSVLGAAPAGEGTLTYTWSTTGAPPAPVAFSVNGTNAAKSTTATFTAAGSYALLVTIFGADGGPVASTVTVAVNQTLTTIAISPTNVPVNRNAARQFTATAFDQFGAALANQPPIAFSLASGGAGSITSAGLYTAPGSDASATVIAAASGVTVSTNVTVTNAPPAAPAGLTASESALAQVNLSWSAVALTTGYTVKRSTTSVGPYSTLASGLTATTFVDATVTAGGSNTTYYYVVSAVNGAFESANSNQAAVSVAYQFLNRAVGGIASANPNASSGNEGPAQAFDGTTGTKWYNNVAGGAGTLQYDFGQGIVWAVARYDISSANDVPQRDPSAWQFQGSNDTIAWATLDTQTGQTFPSRFQSKQYAVANTTAYRYYRLNITAASGGPAYGIQLSELALMAYGNNNQAPTVSAAAGATPSPVTSATTALSVLGADDGGEAALTYGWSVVGQPAGSAAPTFSANGTNAAKNTTATFTQAGTYSFLATITDGGGRSTTSAVNVVVNQTLSAIAVGPASPALSSGATQQFSAVGLDQFGAAMTTQFTWSVAAGGGSVTSGGFYTAPFASGFATVQAASGSVSGSDNLTITDQAPTVATAASATPSPVAGVSASLSVLGADNDGGGESNLTYTWATTGAPPAAVTFSTNSANAAKTTTATFTQAGAYSFRVTITDAGGMSTTSSVNVTVNQTLTRIIVGPAATTAASGGIQQFSATALDQFGAALATQPAIAWSVAAGGGSVSASGLYTAPYAAGSATVQAASGSVTGAASLTITDATPTVATAAAASPNPVTAATTALSVLGADADGGGESNLTYTWTTTGAPPAPVTFSTNGVNAAKNTTAAFTRAGTYNFLVTITDGGGLVTTSSVSVAVAQTLTNVTVSPASTTVSTNSARQFSATGFDQFGAPLASQPAFAWSVASGGGTISAAGLYSAPAAAGLATVRASSGAVSKTAAVTIAAPVRVSLSSSFNRVGVYADRSAFASNGGLDGHGYAMSSALVGSSLTWSNTSFSLGSPGVNDVVRAAGQTISLTAGAYTSLKFVAAGVNGNQANQSFAVHYTDGTTQTFIQGISDWGSSSTLPGESIALSTAYRNRYNKLRQNGPWKVFGYTVALNPGKTVQSITLPNNGNVNLFAITLIN